MSIFILDNDDNWIKAWIMGDDAGVGCEFCGVCGCGGGDIIS